MRMKTVNVDESLEPVDVDKAGSEASEEGEDGLSKMFGVLVYSKVGVYRKLKAVFMRAWAFAVCANEFAFSRSSFLFQVSIRQSIQLSVRSIFQTP